MSHIAINDTSPTVTFGYWKRQKSREGEVTLRYRLTSEDVVLIVLVCIRANIDQTSQAVVVNKLMNQVFVVLQGIQKILAFIHIIALMSLADMRSVGVSGVREILGPHESIAEATHQGLVHGHFWLTWPNLRGSSHRCTPYM